MPGPLSGPRKPHLNSKGGGGKGGEMTPTLYAHINKRKKKKLQGGGSSLLWPVCKEIPAPTASPIIRSICYKFKIGEGKNQVNSNNNNNKTNTKQHFF
jgi:hypothetical protein